MTEPARPPPMPAYDLATPLDRLRQLAETAPLLGVDGAWFAQALARYLAEAPDGLTLDAACGLALGPGGEPWWRTEARKRRDDLIREMRRKFFPTKSTHGAAVAITEAARRYEATAWRRDRTLAAPPHGYAGTIRGLLWRALATGARFPTGWRQITEILDGGILQSNTGVSLQLEPVMTVPSEQERRADGHTRFTPRRENSGSDYRRYHHGRGAPGGT